MHKVENKHLNGTRAMLITCNCFHYLNYHTLCDDSFLPLPPYLPKHTYTHMHNTYKTHIVLHTNNTYHKHTQHTVRHTHKHTHTHTTYTCTNTRHTHTYTRKHKHTHTQTHSETHTHTHTYTHTHTHSETHTHSVTCQLTDYVFHHRVLLR